MNYVARSQQWFQQQTTMLNGFLRHYFNGANAPPRSQATLYRGLEQQALLLAFVDISRWTAVLCFGCMVIVWLFRKVKHGSRSVAAH